jgi:hypothetical protein
MVEGNIFEELVTCSRIPPLGREECLSIKQDKDIRRVDRPYFVIPVSMPHGSNTRKDSTDHNDSYSYVILVILMIVAVAK